MEGSHMKLPQWVIRHRVTRLFALLPVIVGSVVRFARKNIGPTLGLFTVLSENWRYRSQSSIDLLHFEEVLIRRIHQRQMEPSLDTLGSPSNDLKLQVILIYFKTKRASSGARFFIVF